MLLIMIYHSRFDTVSVIYSKIQKYGYSGVDVFLFASGIGCYYSLEKDPDILRFLLRRFRKLGPPYLCFAVLWTLWRAAVKPLPVSAIVGGFLGLESFVSWDLHFNWYISALILFYFLVPYFKRITDSVRGGLGDVLVAAFLVIAAIPFWDAKDPNMIIYARLPIFYLGVVCGKLAKQDLVLNWRHQLMLLTAAVVGIVALVHCRNYLPDYLWAQGLYWYPLIAVVPGVCFVLSLVGDFLQKHRILRWLYRFLDMVGKYSFELYLVHLFLFESVMPHISPMFPEIPHNLLWAATVPTIVAGCFLLNRAAALVSALPGKLTKKNTGIL